MITTWQYTWPAVAAVQPFVGPMQITADTYTSSASGRLYGYNRTDFYYATDAGQSNVTYMRDTRIPSAVKVVRFLGLFTQGGAYVVVGWIDTDLTPTDDMPEFTGNLHILGGGTFREVNKYALLQVKAPSKGLAWKTAISFSVGQVVQFEFVA